MWETEQISQLIQSMKPTNRTWPVRRMNADKHACRA